jgi:hypothetical protein
MSDTKNNTTYGSNANVNGTTIDNDNQNSNSTPLGQYGNSPNIQPRYNSANDPNAPTFENIFNKIFNQSNILMLIWFLAIYLIIYFILGIFYRTNSSTNPKLLASRIFDLLVFVFIIIILSYSFFNLSNSDKEKAIGNYFSSLKNYIDSPLSIYSLILFIFVFYSGIFLIGIPMTYDAKPFSISLVESFSLILLAIILIVDFCKYVLGVEIIDLFNNWLSSSWKGLSSTSPTKPPVNDLSGNVAVSETSPIKDLSNNEVFNISNNLYTYDDAQAICKAYGARLATYDDIEESYNKGGEWCNYGWSDGQMIFFPTQKSTWQKLQKSPSTANKCGRPGINGGYIANPYIKFGVNCYGKKPAPTQADINFMNAQNSNVTAQTPEDALLNKKIQFWKDNADKLLHLNSFNHDKWSEY